MNRRNEDLQRQNTCSTIYKKLKEKKDQKISYTKFIVEGIREISFPENFKHYIGFTYSQFMNVFTFLVPSEHENPLQFKRTFTRREKK